MNREFMKAIEAVDASFGHETAHLAPLEQLEAALLLARRFTETAEEIAREEMTNES